MYIKLYSQLGVVNSRNKIFERKCSSELKLGSMSESRRRPKQTSSGFEIAHSPGREKGTQYIEGSRDNYRRRCVLG